MRFSLLFALALALAACAYAQPDPAQTNPGRPPNPGGGRDANPQQQRQMMNRMNNQRQQTVMEFTSAGLFVLRNGVLVKYDAKTLAEVKSVELFGEMPKAPAPEVTPEERREIMMERAKRSLPGIMLVKDKQMLILIGARFFAIDMATMDVKVNKSIADPKAEQLTFQQIAEMANLQPVLKLDDKTLFISRGNQLISVNIADGEVTARGVLPESMFPKGPPNGGRPPGNRNGGGRNNPQPPPPPEE